MDIKTTLVSTKVHKAELTLDEIKGVAVAAVRKLVGLTDDARVVSSGAVIGDDGSIAVEVVESVPDAAETAAPVTGSNGELVAEAPAAPVGVPGFVRNG